MAWNADRIDVLATWYYSQASCVIVSGFTAALDLDTYLLRNFVHGALNGLNRVEVGIFSLFSRHISRTQSFQQNRHIPFLALVALKLLVSLISDRIWM